MSVDYDNPTYISRNEKAKWGLDILFKQSMNSSIKLLSEFSNQRVQVAKLSLEIPVIIVNVYLPSSSLPETDYDESLNLISSIIAAYSAEAAIILAGDWNSSLYRQNKRDKKFQKFCQLDGLTPAVNTDDIPSYHGYNGTVSKIDYVLAHTDSCATHGVQVTNVRITSHVCKEDDPSIISTHDVLCFEVEYSAPIIIDNPRTEVCESKDISNKIIAWEKADVSLYQNFLESLLDQCFESWQHPENIQILANVIPSTYIYAAELSAPVKTHKKPNYKIFKSEEWRKAEISAKSASKKWRKAGKPRSDESDIFREKKEANANLRNAIKIFNNEKNTSDNNLMMNANFRDPKLFSQLVNKKKDNKSGYTSMIKFDDKEYRGDAQVLSGFFKYHNDKSSPPAVFNSDGNHNYYYSTIDVDAISFIIKQRKWKLPQLNFKQVQNLIERLKSNKSLDFLGISAKHIKYGTFLPPKEGGV